MPCLIFEQSGIRHGGAINGRVLIGRRLTHGVVIGDPTVSRLHAWIDNREGDYVLTDAGSRTGTFVNGEAIVRKYLEDGDEIRVGPVNLVWRDGSDLPQDVQVLDLASPGTIESSRSGILFDCTCGAPMWVGLEYAGKSGLCKYCGEPIRVPSPSKPADHKRSRRPAAPTIRSRCGICHASIDHGEASTRCPECHTSFHVDCWEENYGCATYGCSQVNVLKPAAVTEAEAKIANNAMPEKHEPPASTPWEMILLAASVVGGFVGLVTFGIPAVIVAGACITRLIRGAPKRGLLLLALAVALIGIVLGLALSDFLWLGGQHLASLHVIR